MLSIPHSVNVVLSKLTHILHYLWKEILVRNTKAQVYPCSWSPMHFREVKDKNKGCKTNPHQGRQGLLVLFPFLFAFLILLCPIKSRECTTMGCGTAPIPGGEFRWLRNVIGHLSTLSEPYWFWQLKHMALGDELTAETNVSLDGACFHAKSARWQPFIESGESHCTFYCVLIFV